MKKIFLILTTVSIATSSTYAQTSGNAQNYRICRVDGKYRACDNNMPLIVTTTEPREETEKKNISLRKLDTYTEAKTQLVLASAKRNERIKISYIDDHNSGYEGKETMLNDGVGKNKERNVNYLNASVDLPRVDGNK
jgi:hypothetical protein